MKSYFYTSLCGGVFFFFSPLFSFIFLSQCWLRHSSGLIRSAAPCVLHIYLAFMKHSASCILNRCKNSMDHPRPPSTPFPTVHWSRASALSLDPRLGWWIVGSQPQSLPNPARPHTHPSSFLPSGVILQPPPPQPESRVERPAHHSKWGAVVGVFKYKVHQH